MSPILTTQRDPVAARTSRFAQYSDKNALLFLQKLCKFPTTKLSTGKSLGVIFLISKSAVCDPSVVAKMYTTPRGLEVSTHRELLCLKMFSLFIFLPLFLVLVEGKGNITEGRLRRFLWIAHKTFLLFPISRQWKMRYKYVGISTEYHTCLFFFALLIWQKNPTNLFYSLMY